MSARVVLLCEDERTERFIRRFLWHRNIRDHDIHTLPLPTEGSGEQWVRKRFPDELRAARNKGKLLLAITDADTSTTAKRRSELDRQCVERNVAQRQPKDPVIVLVPRRNIETWLQHLNTGRAVDETHAYKQMFRGLSMKGLRALADELYRMCHEVQKLSTSAPPSLREACVEYPKVTRFVR